MPDMPDVPRMSDVTDGTDMSDMNDIPDTTELPPMPNLSGERRGAILALAQHELQRGVVRRRRRRTIAGSIVAATGMAAIALALAFTLPGHSPLPLRDGGPDANGSRPDGPASDQIVAGDSSPPIDSIPSASTIASMPTPVADAGTSPVSPPVPHRAVIEIVRHSAPSSRVVSIIDDAEMAALVHTLDQPVGLAVIDGQAKLISSAAGRSRDG